MLQIFICPFSFSISLQVLFLYFKLGADIIKWPLLKSPEKYSHASQFTKYVSFITLKGDTLLQIQKLWNVILSVFFQYLSTNKNCPAYKYLKAENRNMSSFLLPPDTYPKFCISIENYEELSKEFGVHLVEDNTIYSSKAPKSHIKLIP